MQTFPRGRLPLGPGTRLRRGLELQVVLDGRAMTAFTGEKIAAVLIADEGLRTRLTASGKARGTYCGMGVCFDCLVVVDGVPSTRACMTLVADGMHIERQSGLGLVR